MNKKAQHDFKKDWERTREQLIKFGKEATILAKKGEVELRKFSKRSKLHMDATALNLKKEKLFYMIGKEYVKTESPAESIKLTKLSNEVKKTEKQQQALRVKLKKTSKKSTE